MLDIILPDGSKKSVESMSVIEFAKTISTSLAKKTVGAIFNGVQVDVSYIINESGELELITTDTKKGLEILTQRTPQQNPQPQNRTTNQNKNTKTIY